MLARRPAARGEPLAKTVRQQRSRFKRREEQGIGRRHASRGKPLKPLRRGPLFDSQPQSSCPGLTRASTSFAYSRNVDGRAQASGSDAVVQTATPGHDEWRQYACFDDNIGTVSPHPEGAAKRRLEG
jgi:hypothetical protein